MTSLCGSMVKAPVVRSSPCTRDPNMTDLSKLTIEDLRKLQAEAQAQIELKERKPGRSRLLQDWHGAIDTVMKAEEGITVVPYPIWQRQQPARTLQKNVAGAEEVARQMFRKKPRRVEAIGAREFVVSMVATYIRQALKLQVTMNSLCSNLGNSGAAIEFSFPSYRRAGVAWMAFEMWTKARAAGAWRP